MKPHTYLWHNEDDGKQAVKLIKAERAWVRRVVQKRTITDSGGEWDKGYNMAIKDILAALKEGR